MIKQSLIPMLLGFLIAAGASTLTRKPDTSEIKTVASVGRYQVKSVWATWGSGVLPIIGDQGDGPKLYAYYVIVATDGSAIRVDCDEYPTRPGDEYRGNWKEFNEAFGK